MKKVYNDTVKHFKAQPIRELKERRIRKFALKLATRLEWCPENFGAKKSWCGRVRTAGKAPNRRQDTIRLFQEWVLAKLTNDGQIESKVAHAKYRELFGANKSYRSWEGFSRCVRKKLNILCEQSRAGVYKSIWKLT